MNGQRSKKRMLFFISMYIEPEIFFHKQGGREKESEKTQLSFRIKKCIFWSYFLLFPSFLLFFLTCGFHGWLLIWFFKFGSTSYIQLLKTNSSMSPHHSEGSQLAESLDCILLIFFQLLPVTSAHYVIRLPIPGLPTLSPFIYSLGMKTLPDPQLTSCVRLSLLDFLRIRSEIPPSQIMLQHLLVIDHQ